MSEYHEEMLRKRELIALKEKQIKLREGLPFLYGWKWYPWARQFFESTNHMNFLCAANQVSKSSSQIRKCVDWATDQSKWPTLWPANKPMQFWYLYPTGNQANAEWLTKWQQFLPRGEYKDDPYYGWKEEKKQGNIYAIHFNSGVHVFFKTYAQDESALQTGTCDALFCDEELPTDLYDELIFRISASDGYFHMVFTATLGQEYWRLTMEPGSQEEENLPDAAKWTVSMYDCQFYEDGTPSHWTLEKIKLVENRCKSRNEVLKRVHGRFIMDIGGRKYPSFEQAKNVKPGHPLPEGWHRYVGVDIGSGGTSGHPSAIVFIGVKPDFTEGRVFMGWRGDGIVTTASDVVNKFIEMKGQQVLSGQYYDWASKDFFEIATRMGHPFQQAEKSHEKGEQVLNVLFKSGMLAIYDDPELRKLAQELATLRKDAPKNKAKDDFTDALRYAATRIPWDWSVATRAEENPAPPPKPLSAMQQEVTDRRKAFEDGNASEYRRIEEEFNEIAELLDG